MRATFKSSGQNRCCSTWWNSLTGFSLEIDSPERNWVSIESWKGSFVPPLQCGGTVLPLHSLIETSVSSFFLLSPFLRFVKGLTFSISAGRMSSSAAVYIMLSVAQSLPRSMLSSQKKPVVLRYRCVSCCAVVQRWSAVMFACCIAVKVSGLCWLCGPVHEHQVWPVWYIY